MIKAPTHEDPPNKLQKSSYNRSYYSKNKEKILEKARNRSLFFLNRWQMDGVVPKGINIGGSSNYIFSYPAQGVAIKIRI